MLLVRTCGALVWGCFLQRLQRLLRQHQQFVAVIAEVSSQDAQVKIVSNLDMKELDKAPGTTMTWCKQSEKLTILSISIASGACKHKICFGKADAVVWMEQATQRLLRFGRSDSAEPGGCSPFGSRPVTPRLCHR